jgi:hypothetical protein
VVVRFSSGEWLGLLSAVLLLAACASEAPPLPPDTTSVTRSRDLNIDDFTAEARAMSCSEITDERRKIADAMETASNTIAGNRTRNQILVGVFSLGGLVAAPVLLAAEHDDAAKDEITKLYERRDTLMKLATLKHCPAPPPS